MNKLTTKEIRKLEEKDLKNEILNIKRILFDFRLKKATRQTVKPHIIKGYKQQLARLMTIEHQKYTNH